jgi:ABC1 atypical kinase-like domain
VRDDVAEPDAARVVALADELQAQLARLKGGGPKIVQFLSMLGTEGGSSSPGARPPEIHALPFDRVKRVVERDLGTRVGRIFDEIDEAPFALASLGQVHRARTRDGDDVAVKVQHPGVAEAVESDLRNVGVVGPILKRLAPGLDAGAVLAELRDRVSDELDYEIEAQNQRRLGRMFRGHPHVRVPRVHTDLSARRVLVSEYAEGAPVAELDDAGRDRAGEIAFRFFVGLAWRDGIVAGDPQPENCLLCPDGRLCLLDFALLRELPREYLDGERAIMRALAGGDAQGVHDGLATLGYLPDSRVDPAGLLDLLATAGGWMFVPGFVRLGPQRVAEILERGYPPRSPHFMLMRRLRMPARTLLLRRMELQLVGLLSEWGAGADWGAITAEYHSDTPAATAIGREERAYVERAR